MLTTVAIVLAGMGALLVIFGVRALRPNRAMLATRTTAVSELKAGAVELAGVIEPSGADALESGASRPCVIVHTVVDNKVGRNNFKEVSRETRAVPAVLRDASGACPISLAHVELLGETWERLDAGGRTTEIVIPAGARVVITGVARLEAHPGEGDYRGGAQRLVVGGTPEAPLVIAIGEQTAAVWRYGWRALVGIACGVGLWVVAGAALFVRSLLGG